ncbi:MAG: molybdopterin-dependent oxidoreductase [Spirochaetaceae bacterium]|nr:molybdopterin-dependent oxidoreductase [Spirochaetaceae bacterium]HPG24710.1 molybdopterin-dependent oxidoreductase [Myxococcota bacterium]
MTTTAPRDPQHPLEVVRRSCPICEACCGLRVHVDREARRIERIEGDPEDWRSRGYLCPKAYGMKGVYEDPDRLRRPLRKRDDGGWEEIDWESAYELAGTRLRAIREAHGTPAIGLFVGEPTGHDVGALLYTTLFMQSFQSPRLFSSATMDQFPKNVTLKRLLGDGEMYVIPDLPRTDLFICLGGNPLASQGSLMGTPNARGALRAIRERGGRVIVIDPRRTETAEIADEHHFIRPGADAFLLAAICQVVFEEGLVRLGRFADFTDGVDEIRRLVAPFTPEAVATATGLSADTIRRLAREYATTERAALYGRIGTCTQEFGTLASWLLDVAAILTGHFDEPGCMGFPRPATGDTEPGRETPALPVGLFRTVGRGLPLVDGQLPAGTVAEEIEEAVAGEHRMRALVTVAANPVLSAPNGDRLASASNELDFMVSVDIYLNETTSHADLILPTRVHAERANYDLVYTRTCSHNYARYSPRLFEPDADLPDHWEVILELAARATGTTAEALDDALVDDLITKVTAPGALCEGVPRERILSAIGDKRGPMRVLDLMLRSGPYGDRFDAGREGLSLARVIAADGPIDLGPLEPRLPGALKTPDGRIPLAHDYITADVPRLREALERRSGEDGLRLVGRRQVRNMNSWLHNVPVLARGRNRCTLLISPVDATRLGIDHGAKARVRSRSGEVVVEAEVSDEMMPGVVSLPHGFGHTRKGSRLGVAATTQPGVNANQLTDELPLDVPSGTHIANGIPVEVEAA